MTNHEPSGTFLFKPMCPAKLGIYTRGPASINKVKSRAMEEDTQKVSKQHDGICCISSQSNDCGPTPKLCTSIFQIISRYIISNYTLLYLGYPSKEWPWSLSYSAQAAGTKLHKLGGLITRHLLLKLGGWSVRSNAAWLSSGEASLPYRLPSSRVLTGLRRDGHTSLWSLSLQGSPFHQSRLHSRDFIYHYYFQGGVMCSHHHIMSYRFHIWMERVYSIFCTHSIHSMCDLSQPSRDANPLTWMQIIVMS